MCSTFELSEKILRFEAQESRHLSIEASVSLRSYGRTRRDLLTPSQPIGDELWPQS